jgi:hypothetical protein
VSGNSFQKDTHWPELPEQFIPSVSFFAISTVSDLVWKSKYYFIYILPIF